MALTTYYDPMLDFSRLIDDALDTRFPSSWWPAMRSSQGESDRDRVMKPRMDLHEDTRTNTVTATFELPGLKKEDVKIDLQNNRLHISGECKMEMEREDSNKKWAVRERCYGKFSRSLQMASGIKPEQIKASMENGVLTVTFPKTTAEQTAKRIAVA